MRCWVLLWERGRTWYAYMEYMFFFLVYMLHIPFILLFNYVCLYYSCRFSCPMAWLMNKYVLHSTCPALFSKQCDSFTAHSWYVISGHRTSNLVCRADKCSIITTRASKIEPWSCVYTAKDPWEVLTRKTDFGLSSGSPMACPDESRELRRLLSLKLLGWDIV